MSEADGTASGLVVVDKEPGWTSHDVVARCRRIFGQRRVGHAGTLDPDASGLVLVGLGRATRLLRFVTALPKTYRAEVVLGATTTTLDASGTVTARFEMGGVTVEQVRDAARRLTGEILQVPPMVSAVKVGGVPLHRLARQGLEVERQARPVTVHRFEILTEVEPGVFAVEVECSAGTYVRVLAADLGVALSGGAHLRNLRRVRVGSFSEDDAHSLEDLAACGRACVLAPAEALRDVERVVVDGETRQLVAFGRALNRAALGAHGSGPWRLVDEQGDLLAVYEAALGDRIRPAVVLAS